ncbi:MerR family transcriptional regulator [Frankia canadensis]|uniref:MerR family transcriptional regulator n=1 Tax=Frankia canadensis TaxID=1836972 RepID=A0A2I2KM25_9ACTN|nr:MerR family transcriptional regulator [Frankia canadensis]SNQ46696.1 MerR family transcriptional regulator [Frankia canadensis]SOU53986.1 MerR family transcriptional regulator [Frankia canadensis]
MLIGELSRRTGVHAHLLRYYEAQGLLRPARASSGYREYGDDAVLTITQIRKLLDAGLSTREIKVILPCATGSAPDLEPCTDLLDTLRARLHDLDERIDTLDRSRRALRGHIAAAEGRRPAAAHPACPPAVPVTRTLSEHLAGAQRH